MAKQVEGFIKLQVRGGQANPAPPVGPALGAKGVNIMEFCKRFNAKSQDQQGKILPVIITVYKDKSFDFVIKTPPASVQLLEAAQLKKGSPESNRAKVGTVTWDQVKAIAEDKMPDLNAFTVESGMKMVAGTARSMGIIVKGSPPWHTGPEEEQEEYTIVTQEEIEAMKAEAAGEAEEDTAGGVEETPVEQQEETPEETE